MPDELAIERTHLAEQRTQLAHERTILAYMRTATTVILFGIAFLGFSDIRYDFYWYAGWISTGTGVLFLIAALISGWRHTREIGRILRLFRRTFWRDQR